MWRRTSTIVRFAESNISRYSSVRLSLRPYCCVYTHTYSRSLNNPEEFWSEQANHLTWIKPFSTALDHHANAPASTWFPDGTLNMCQNALDENIKQGRGNQPALIFESGYTGTKVTLTYQELLDKVSMLAKTLQRHGCRYSDDGTEGQMVLIYMANGIESAIAMLACSRIGVPHSVVFGGFAAQELSVRIKHAHPTIIIASSCGIEPKGVIEYKPLLDEALRIAGKSDIKTIIHQREQCKANLIEGRDFDWDTEMNISAKNPEIVPPVPVPSSHPLYVLYTSGTTGQPKGIVRDTGGYATALKWSMYNIYGMKEGDVFWASSDVGWVVGHSYIVYGPLLKGCTSFIFEGKPIGTPDAGIYWKMIQDYNVKALFCAPTVFRAIKQEDPQGKLISKYDLSHLKALFLAGERADPPTVQWAQEKLHPIPVIDHYWQTETGWPLSTNYLSEMFKPIKVGSSSLPVPGYNVHVLDKEGEPVIPGTLGNICVRPPLPPGCLISLFKYKDGMKSTYFSPHTEYYNTGDSGYLDEDGYLYIMTRTGDIINVAGHRLSTGSLEEALSSHPKVAECAVVGLNDNVKGQVPLGLIVLSHQDKDVEIDIEAIKKECIQLVLKIIGPVAAFRKIIEIKRLPKTRSGKILRGVLQNIVNGEQYTAPPTTEDLSVFPEIKQSLKEAGLLIQEKE